jgi:hypothetical protein
MMTKIKEWVTKKEFTKNSLTLAIGKNQAQASAHSEEDIVHMNKSFDIIYLNEIIQKK